MLSRIIVCSVFLILSACQAVIIGEKPSAVSSMISEFAVHTPYVFFTGFLKVRRELPAGRYHATYRDHRGIYYTMDSSAAKEGVFIVNDQSAAYVFGIATEQSAEANNRAAVNMMTPAARLISELILPEPKPGEIAYQIRVTGDWKSAFDFIAQKPANQALQHNDHSCHELCLRTPRASCGRG
jgi:hypothetical protein